MTQFNVAIAGFEHPHIIARLESIKNDPSAQAVASTDHDYDLGRFWSKKYNIPFIPDQEEVFSREDVHLVILDSWDHLNPDLAALAVKYKKPFILEKPGAPNLESMRALADTVDASGVFSHMGYFARYSPAVQRAKEILESGALGPVSVAHIEGSTPVGGSNEIWQSRPEDRGGMLFTIGCHMMDLAVYFLGSPTVKAGYVLDLPPGPEVTAYNFKKDSYTIEGATKSFKFGDCTYEDVATALLDFGGIAATFSFTGWDSRPWVRSFRMAFTGARGHLEVRLDPALVRLELREPHERNPAGISEFTFAAAPDWGPGLGSILPYWNEFQDVKSRVKNGGMESANPVSTGLKVMEALERIYELSNSHSR